MVIYCHTCQQTSDGRQTQKLMCPKCGSEAVQILNQQNNYNRSYQNQRHENNYMQRQRQHNFSLESNPLRQNYMPFSHGIQQIIERRRNNIRGLPLTEPTSIDSIFNRMNSIKQMMRMPSFMDHQQGFPNMLSNRPFVYRQIISGGPRNQSFYYYNSSQDDQSQVMDWQLPEVQPRRPKVTDYPKLNYLKQECSICNTKQNQGIILPCGHKFHKDCIIPWFQIKDICPCCRYKL